MGSNNPAEVESRFSTGVERIKPRLGAKTMELLPIEDCGLEPIDTALDEIRQAVPALRYLVLEACASTVATDGTLTSGEFCLIQAIAAALDCPLPALLQQLPTEPAAATHPSGSRIT